MAISSRGEMGVGGGSRGGSLYTRVSENVKVRNLVNKITPAEAKRLASINAPKTTTKKAAAKDAKASAKALKAVNKPSKKKSGK